MKIVRRFIVQNFKWLLELASQKDSKTSAARLIGMGILVEWASSDCHPARRFLLET
jgi:hypothetical protein